MVRVHSHAVSQIELSKPHKSEVSQFENIMKKAQQRLYFL